MKILAKIGMFALALILSALPTMACMLPNATLTTAEHACCKHMASECGHPGMPSSHSCCQQLTPEASSFLKAPSVVLDHVASTSYLLPVSVPLFLNGNPPIHTTFDGGVHGPPGSPLVTTSVLRI